MDFEEFEFDDEDMPEEVKAMMETAQSDYAKAYGAQILAVDLLYDFVNGLDESQLAAFLKLMQSCAQDDHQPTFWAGYVRAIRFMKFGINPNPYAPKFNEEDILAAEET